MKVIVDIDRITIKDFSTLLEAEKGDDKAQVIVEQLWRFIADDEGKYLPENEAREAVQNMGLGTALTAARDIAAKMKEYVQGAIPPNTEAG